MSLTQNIEVDGVTGGVALQIACRTLVVTRSVSHDVLHKKVVIHVLIITRELSSLELMKALDDVSWLIWHWMMHHGSRVFTRIADPIKGCQGPNITL